MEVLAFAQYHAIKSLDLFKDLAKTVDLNKKQDIAQLTSQANDLAFDLNRGDLIAKVQEFIQIGKRSTEDTDPLFVEWMKKKSKFKF